MGFLSLFSGLLYKGSYNVEVRRGNSAPLLGAARVVAAGGQSRDTACTPRARTAAAQSARRRGGHSRRRACVAGACVATPRARALTYPRGAQVTVADSEPAESALRRFRKSVLNSGVLPEVCFRKRARAAALECSASGCAARPRFLEPPWRACCG